MPSPAESTAASLESNSRSPLASPPHTGWPAKGAGLTFVFGKLPCFLCHQYIVLATTICCTFIKYGMNVYDIQYDEGAWGNKSLYISYLDVFTGKCHIARSKQRHVPHGTLRFLARPCSCACVLAQGDHMMGSNGQEV